MKITNVLGLPEPLVDMATSDYVYAPNEYRVTSLLKGIREAVLEQRHRDEIEQDVSDMVWLLFGTAVHGVVEQAKESPDQIKENRVKVEIGGRVLSGQFDLYDDRKKKVTDYKTCSVWKIKFADFDDWRRQILIYAWLLRKKGYDVREGEIVAFIKDHSKREAKIKADYPKLPVFTINWRFSDADYAECEAWLNERIAARVAAEALPDNELPICTPDERYNDGDKFAVMRKGRKTALRVLDTLDAAEDWKTSNGGDYIETRPGTDKKCIDYCAVCEFCGHYRKNVKGADDGQS